MNFYLPFQVADPPCKISYQDKLLMIGSCFSEEIGSLMKAFKFQVLQNPRGIVYDPLSICSTLNSLVDGEVFEEKNLFFLDGLWQSWQHHSVFSGREKGGVLQKINESQQLARNFLKEAAWLIITPGTAYHYLLKENAAPVANCHKAPSRNFDKKLPSSNEIIGSLNSMISKLKEFNPRLRILFTVSPVRHIREGLIENNRSKASLIEAIHFVVENTENVFYFPAYELVVDVLRDYRFFKSDLVHPNDNAIEYVFDQFCSTWISDEDKKLFLSIQSILKASRHRPFQKSGNAYRDFALGILEKIKEIQKEYPWIDFSHEIAQFQQTGQRVQ